MLETHKSLNADATATCMRVPHKEADQFGIITTDNSQKIIHFQEKPESARACEDDPNHALASMGIYIFDQVTNRRTGN